MMDDEAIFVLSCARSESLASMHDWMFGDHAGRVLDFNTRMRLSSLGRRDPAGE